MIDKKKRDTLKILGAASAVAAVPSVLNAKAFGENIDSVFGSSEALANIDIKVRVSVTSNDLELLVTNTGSDATTITQLTPSQVTTGRGHFDLQAMLANGPLELKAGESVTVPLAKHRNVNLMGVSNSLVSDLRDRVSIITDNNAFAAVSVSRMPFFV